MTDAEKVRENRLRRAARRQGYVLRKSRTRDPLALDYGRWYVLDPDRGFVVGGGNNRMDLDAVEAWLNTPREER